MAKKKAEEISYSEVVVKPSRNETRTERLNLLITPSLNKKVRKKCKKMGISINECVNQLLTKWSEE